MKRTLKAVSLILVVIMLVTSVPMQGFALFDQLWPKVIAVEFQDNVPISNKYVQLIASENLKTDNVKYDLGGEFLVYLSNGRTIEVSENSDGSDLFSGVLNTFVSMYVDPKECAEAIKNHRNTVDVNVTVRLLNLDDTFRGYTFEVEKEIVDEIVTDIDLVSAKPKIYDQLNPCPDFVGKKFEVKYYDGTKETLTLEDRGESGYFLGNREISMQCKEFYYANPGWDGGDNYYTDLIINYIDMESILDTKSRLWYYTDLDIIDYKLDGKGGITEITYRLMQGYYNPIEKLCVLDEPINFNEYIVINTENGGDIVATARSLGDSSYYIACSLGYSPWDLYTYVLCDDITEFCDCLCHKEGKLNNIIYTFLLKLWQIFGINETCQCGLCH